METKFIVKESECWKAGKKDLKGRWLEAALLTFVLMLITILVSGIVGGGLDLIYKGLRTFSSLLLLPLSWGWSMTFLECHRGENDPFNDPFNIKNLFVGYNKDFSRIFTTLFLQTLYTILWTLLLIVPGIIKSLSYALTPYILKDYPELKNNQPIELSMAMMQGYKLELFILQLKYFGLCLLGILTLGIAYFWIAPFYSAAMVNFYEEVKKAYNERSGNTF
ncbi:MAG: DUF975 family protein [Bacteroidaceae bacterium]|nr:DUF975 family protein [Bacteroidaceae bacterium]